MKSIPTLSYGLQRLRAGILGICKASHPRPTSQYWSGYSPQRFTGGYANRSAQAAQNVHHHPQAAQFRARPRSTGVRRTRDPGPGLRADARPRCHLTLRGVRSFTQVLLSVSPRAGHPRADLIARTLLQADTHQDARTPRLDPTPGRADGAPWALTSHLTSLSLSKRGRRPPGAPALLQWFRSGEADRQDKANLCTLRRRVPAMERRVPAMVAGSVCVGHRHAACAVRRCCRAAGKVGATAGQKPECALRTGSGPRCVLACL
jgi:hypothetical protein